MSHLFEGADLVEGASPAEFEDFVTTLGKKGWEERAFREEVAELWGADWHGSAVDDVSLAYCWAVGKVTEKVTGFRLATRKESRISSFVLRKKQFDVVLLDGKGTPRIVMESKCGGGSAAARKMKGTGSIHAQQLAGLGACLRWESPRPRFVALSGVPVKKVHGYFRRGALWVSRGLPFENYAAGLERLRMTGLVDSAILAGFMPDGRWAFPYASCSFGRYLADLKRWFSEPERK